MLYDQNESNLLKLYAKEPEEFNIEIDHWSNLTIDMKRDVLDLEKTMEVLSEQINNMNYQQVEDFVREKCTTVEIDQVTTDDIPDAPVPMRAILGLALEIKLNKYPEITFVTDSCEMDTEIHGVYLSQHCDGTQDGEDHFLKVAHKIHSGKLKLNQPSRNQHKKTSIGKFSEKFKAYRGQGK